MRGGHTRLTEPLPDIPARTMTAEIARRLWTYDRETGALIWNVSPQLRVKIGDRAGYLDPSGYWTINFKYGHYRNARLAWLIVTGCWPDPEVDHENGIRSDDCWGNLREATRTQQLANTATRSDNALGVKGVRARDGVFIAAICSKGKREYLGRFPTVEAAKAAYDTAAERLFGDFRRQAA